MEVASLLRAVVATAAVLGLLGALAWAARRGTLALPGRRGRLPITVETAVPLGDRRSVAIVVVEGRRLLLGLSPASVSLLTELGPPQAGFDAALDASLGSDAQGGRR